MQDYAKAIYALEMDGGAGASTSALAGRLGVTSPSVSAVLHRLEERGLVTCQPYHGAHLT